MLNKNRKIVFKNKKKTIEYALNKLNNKYNENEVPYISTYHFNTVLDINDSQSIDLYITDWNHKEWIYDDYSETFTVKYEVNGVEYKVENCKAGNMSITFDNTCLGENSFSVQVIDNRGRKSHRLYNEFLVVDNSIPKLEYTVTDNDLANYKINKNNSMVELDMNDTRIGLTKLFDDLRKQGYDKIIMPFGIYRVLSVSTYQHDTKNSIIIPSGLTVDLNGSTIKQHTFVGDYEVLIAFVDTFNSHLVNGVLEGYYKEIELPDERGEHCYLLDMKGDCKYSTVENITFLKSVGYTCQSTFSNSNICKGNASLNSVDIVDGIEIEVDNRCTTGYYDLSEIISKGDKYVQCNIFLAYSGCVSGSWIQDFHFYDEDYNYIQSTRGFQYRKTLIPNQSKYVRVTFHDKTENVNMENVSVHNIKFPYNCTFKKCRFENTRTCGIAFTQMQNMLFEDITFKDCALTNNMQELTPLAIDFEDGWYGMLDITMRNMIFENHVGTGDCIICSGHNFVIENSESFKNIDFRGGWNGTRGGVIRNCTGLGKVTLSNTNHKTSAFFRVYNNEIKGTFSPSYYNKDVETPIIMIKDCLVETGESGGTIEYKKCIFDGSLSNGTMLHNIKATDSIIRNYLYKGNYVYFGNNNFNNCTIENINVRLQGGFIVKNSTIADVSITPFNQTNSMNIENNKINNMSILEMRVSNAITDINIFRNDISEFTYKIQIAGNKNILFDSNSITSSKDLIVLTENNYNNVKVNTCVEFKDNIVDTPLYVISGNYTPIQEGDELILNDFNNTYTSSNTKFVTQNIIDNKYTTINKS